MIPAADLLAYRYERNPATGDAWICSDAPLTDSERDEIVRAAIKHGADYALVRATPDGAELLVEYRGARPFERIRRITGYLVGTLDRFNDAKRAEERDRVRHDVTSDGGSGAR